jgi:hypothetical protein
MSAVLERAKNQFIRCCIEQPRYHVAWLIGPPLSGKSRLARQLSSELTWQYLDYTTTHGYFDSLQSRIDHYQPLDFIKDIQQWCVNSSADVLILDEIDSILACWSGDQRKVWISRIAKLTEPSRGLILVSHIIDYSILSAYFPDGDTRYCVHIGEG